MYTANLRKVGGSVMLAVPSAILDLLQLHAGSSVGLVVDHGRLVIEPTPPPHYSLDELLAQCDPAAEISSEDRTWVSDKPVGSEMI